MNKSSGKLTILSRSVEGREVLLSDDASGELGSVDEVWFSCMLSSVIIELRILCISQSFSSNTKSDIRRG